MDNQPILLEQEELKALWFASIMLLSKPGLSEASKKALITAKEKIYGMIEEFEPKTVQL